MSSQKKGSQKYTKWTEYENEVLLQLLVDAMKNGMRGKGGGILKTYCETVVVSSLNKKCNGNKTVNHVSNKIKKWRSKYKEVKDLMTSCSGFSWDSTTSKITAPQEVWDDYFKKHPHAKDKDYRSKKYSQYNDWKMIFEGSDVVGENACETSADGLQGINEDNFDVELDGSLGESPFDKSDDPKIGEDCSCRSQQLSRSKQPIEQIERKRARTHYDDVGERMASSLEKLVQSSTSKDDWCKALFDTPGLDDSMRMEGATLLKTPEQKMVFAMMAPESRKKWILSQLHK